jgi:hypothetical protein
MPHRQNSAPAPFPEGIAGGQQSICARVSEAAKEALDLLAELQPIGLNPDLKAIDELKAWIRSEFMELVGELTFAEGPSVVRVEEVFSMLLDQMGTLQDLVEDEEGTTVFPALADNIASLYRSWNNMQQLFEVQVGIVIKHLGIAQEAIEQVRGNMDYTSGASLNALLNSIQTFLSETAPRAISEGGGFALRSRIAPAAGEWCSFVRASLIDTSLYTPQLTRALAALAGRMDEVAWNC